jgi:hypothetical protein
MKNEWTGNIPVNGILCRDTRSGNIYRVMRLSKDPHDKYCLVDDSCHVHDIVDTVPLTPQEVWDLMPWQPMNSAPKDGSSLLLELEQEIRGRGKYHTGSFNVNGVSIIAGRMGFDCPKPIAWLPLPEIK